MAKKTVIVTDFNNRDEKTKLFSSHKEEKIIEQVQRCSQEQKKRFSTLQKIAFAGAGIAGGIGLMSFMPKGDPIPITDPIALPENPPQAISVDDSMSYQEAFESARNEVGQGGYFVWKDNVFTTYTQEEWSVLGEESQLEFNRNLIDQLPVDPSPVDPDMPEPTPGHPFIYYDKAPVATQVNDGMSFSDAFAVARQEVGPGGVFTWNGNTYNTYIKEEWDAMGPAERQQFSQSVNHTELIGEVKPSDINDNPDVIIVNDPTDEVFVRDEYITGEDGEVIHIGHFMKNGEHIIKIDANNDDVYDYVLDANNNRLIGLNGNEDLDLSKIQEGGETQDPKVIFTDTIIDDDGSVMHVKLYSDGTQQALIDYNGDGVIDGTITVYPSGEMSFFEADGTLIYQGSADDFSRYYAELDTVDPIDIEPVDIDMNLAPNDNINMDLDDHHLDFDNNSDMSEWV